MKKRWLMLAIIIVLLIGGIVVFRGLNSREKLNGIILVENGADGTCSVYHYNYFDNIKENYLKTDVFYLVGDGHGNLLGEKNVTEIWECDQNGQENQITDVSNAGITGFSDLQYYGDEKITFIANENELYEYSRKTGEFNLIYNGIRKYKWNSDYSKLYFINAADFHLYSVDWLTKEEKKEVECVNCFDVSYDGKKLIYHELGDRESGTFVKDLQTGAIQEIEKIGFVAGGIYPSFSFSENGEYILVWRKHNTLVANTYSYAVYDMGKDKLYQITEPTDELEYVSWSE